jgi:tetratricopeptide (TPR) repeat protein
VENDFLLFSLFSASFLAFTQTGSDPFWYTLEQGKRYFRNGDYGEALRSFEDAREERKDKYASMERDLITVLSIHEVRLFGDDLGLLETYIQKQYRTGAAEALKELYYRVPRERLGNSSKKALEEIGRLKEYPEAEYWIGEAYRMEGEFGIALNQYRKAYDRRDLLESPEFSSELLYKMAEIYRLRREYTEMRKNLEEILKTDASWNVESFTRTAMVNNAVKNGLDRFLVLYRHNNPSVEKAHRTLGLYYYTNGRYSQAVEHLLFSFLIQNTIIIDAVKKDRYNYSFSSLGGLQADIAALNRESRQNIESYIADVEYFKTIFYLANSFYGDGKGRSAREGWDFLRLNGQGEWRTRALNQLSGPQLDRVPQNTQEALN